MPVHVDIGDFLRATIALIAIANPFAALSVFVSLVPSDDPAAQRHAANRVALAVLAILAGAVLVGQFVLQGRPPRPADPAPAERSPSLARPGGVDLLNCSSIAFLVEA